MVSARVATTLRLMVAASPGPLMVISSQPSAGSQRLWVAAGQSPAPFTGRLVRMAYSARLPSCQTSRN
ncbi:hypothetical protein D9M69_548980 [compost metagenome]